MTDAQPKTTSQSEKFKGKGTLQGATHIDCTLLELTADYKMSLSEDALEAAAHDVGYAQRLKIQMTTTWMAFVQTPSPKKTRNLNEF